MLAVSSLWLNTKGNSMKKYVLALCVFTNVFLSFQLYLYFLLYICNGFVNSKKQQTLISFFIQCFFHPQVTYFRGRGYLNILNNFDKCLPFDSLRYQNKLWVFCRTVTMSSTITIFYNLDQLVSTQNRIFNPSLTYLA